MPVKPDRLLAFAVDAAQHSAHQAWATLSPWRERWPIWLGWAALICLMCGLAAAFSRKLGYPVWRWLHGLLVLAVLFGFAHLILLGLSQTLLFALLLATVLMLWRVLRIDCGLAARPFLVDHVETQANGVLEISLRPLATLLNAKPGQFAMFAFFDGPHSVSYTHLDVYKRQIYANRRDDRVRLLLMPGSHDEYSEIEQHIGTVVEFLDGAISRGEGI